MKYALPAMALLLATTPLQAQDNLRSSLSGVYTAAQAERGRQLYAFRCVRCHETGFDGAPRLDAGRLGSDFQGHPVFDLADLIHSSMPVDEPGTTSRADAADLAAFLLSQMNMPPGDSELASGESDLRLIRIDIPK